MSLHIPADEVGRITPERAGWTYCGLGVVSLAAGETFSVPTEDVELFVLPLTGSLSVRVTAPDGSVEGSFDLAGRTSVFDSVSDFVYVGRDSTLDLTTAAGAEIALPSARCDNRLPARYGAAADVPVEVRGAGLATRQVTNFGVPGVWDHADKLICCEVLTPPGNWSSWPPHKHDASEPCPVVDEEIYFYRIAGEDQIMPSRQGFGWHRTYTASEHERAGLDPLDASLEVRDGDVVLVPYGYHGPCAAAPGYPMYYLNVMAGPGDERSMNFCDDPAHAWIRASWDGMPIDPRCPMTSAHGRVSR